MSKERYKPLNSNDGESERTEETDYMVTATTAQAGKPDTDLEIAAPILTEPLTTSSSEQLIKNADGSMGKIGFGTITKRLKVDGCDWFSITPKVALQAGDSKHSAKQTTFGTMLAGASSSAF